MNKRISYFIIPVFLIILALSFINMILPSDTNKVSSTTKDSYAGGECCSFNKYITPASGNVKLPVFMVDFPDERYESNALSVKGFAWYDSNGRQTISTGIKIHIKKMTKKKCTLSITYNN